MPLALRGESGSTPGSPGQEFQRYKVMQARVFCLIDHAHATAAQLLDDVVMRDGLAD
jgi:hypothetical protein